MIAIIDYKAGNLFSVKNALDFLGVENVVTADSETLQEADGIILPGVGAFPAAKQSLDEKGITPLLQTFAQQKPLLGICLGFQLLFSYSTEFAKTEGLGLIPGYVDRVDDFSGELKVPHMGWNALHLRQDCPILGKLREGDSVYFVHSYRAFTESAYLVADADYGSAIPAMVQNGKVFGCQFHPEKSGELGLSILRAFASLSEGEKSLP